MTRSGAAQAAGTVRRQYRFTTTPEHLILDPRLSDRAFRLWCRLDRIAGDKDSSFPSHVSLAMAMGTSVDSIKRAQNELLATGWLHVQHVPGGTSVYTLMILPKEPVEKLIAEAAAARKAEWAPKLEKRREVKKAAKASSALVSVKPSTVQVIEGGECTSALPPQETPEPEGGSAPMHYIRRNQLRRRRRRTILRFAQDRRSPLTRTRRAAMR